jgi:predicted ATPase/DNA-binding SARP family transcriptional activator/Tfp pilus assembly protein PilF
MVAFRLQLLGTFQATVNDAPVATFRSDKSRALLAYLALNGRYPHPRDTLATLLWGDYTQQAARASLRQTLSNLRQVAAPLLATDPPALTITPQAVSLDNAHPDLWVDVVAFRALLAQVETHAHPHPDQCPDCRGWLATAVALYQGDFLPGLQLDDAADFADWRLLQQESLHQQALHALQRLSASYAASGDLTRQTETLRRLLQLLPWQENAHRELMDVLARAGQRAAALAQYDRCRQILADELGVEPTSETTALYRLIQADALPASPPRPAAPRHNLPPPATPLIGRDDLLQQATAVLTHPDTRLLTLLGPGGVGKTRLALAVARQLVADFADGVWFAPLADVTSPTIEEGEQSARPTVMRQAMASAVADSLSLTLQQPGQPWETLIAYFQQKTALLILDNLEHLLPDAAAFVTDLLAAAPRLTILTTSQARLRARAEQLLPLSGLAWPESDDISLETAVHNGSIALFTERAGRTLAGFQLKAANLPAVAAICRLLDGLPLALELTAALVEHFTPEEIAATLRHDLAALADAPGAADLPPRQQSITAVFDYAWRLLTPAEQETLAQISLFRGEFSRAAALEVSQGSLAALAALVDKSLLRVARPGRYALHALVRHFAATTLEARPALHAAAQARYVAVYVAFLQQQQPLLQGPQQRVASAAIRQELDNVRQAWETAVAAADIAHLNAMLTPLAAFFHDSGKPAAGLALFTATRKELPDTGAGETAVAHFLARLDVWRGLYMGEMGQIETAVRLLQTTLSLLQESADALSIAHCQRILGSMETRLSQLESGIARLQQARHTFATLGDQIALASTLSALGRAWEFQGEYDQAQTAMAHSLRLLRRQGTPQMLVNALNHYGLLLYRLGDNEGATAVLREAVTLDDREGGNRSGLGVTLTNLGLALAAQGDYAAAQATYEQALRIQQEVGNQNRIAILLNNLGDVANEMGQPERALVYLQESLAIKQRMGNEGGMTFSLVHLGHAYWHLGQVAEAVAAYRQAALLAEKLALRPLLLAAFVGLAEVALRWQEQELARQMLALAWSHPASWQRVRDEATAVASRYDLSLDTLPDLPDLAEVTRRALTLPD